MQHLRNKWTFTLKKQHRHLFQWPGKACNGRNLLSWPLTSPASITYSVFFFLLFNTFIEHCLYVLFWELSIQWWKRLSLYLSGICETSIVSSCEMLWTEKKTEWRGRISACWFCRQRGQTSSHLSRVDWGEGVESPWTTSTWWDSGRSRKQASDWRSESSGREPGPIVEGLVGCAKDFLHSCGLCCSHN